MTNTRSSERERLWRGMKNRMNFGGTCSYRLQRSESLKLKAWFCTWTFRITERRDGDPQHAQVSSLPVSRATNGQTEPYTITFKTSKQYFTMLLVPNTSAIVNFMIAPPGSSHRPDNDNSACCISDNEQCQKVPINKRSKKMYACCVYQYAQ